MITAEQIVMNDNRIAPIAEKYANKIARNNYTVEMATHELMKTAVEVLIRKLNGRPALSHSSYGRVECNQEFSNEVYEMFDCAPKVGMACTEILYSDKYACEITKVVSPRKICVRMKDYKVKDWQDGEGEVIDRFRKEDEEVFTLRKGGGWIAQGQPNYFGSVVLAVGYARTYIDPSF